jgi:hypothetical protein
MSGGGPPGDDRPGRAPTVLQARFGSADGAADLHPNAAALLLEGTADELERQLLT